MASALDRARSTDDALDQARPMADALDRARPMDDALDQARSTPGAMDCGPQAMADDKPAARAAGVADSRGQMLNAPVRSK